MSLHQPLLRLRRMRASKDAPAPEIAQADTGLEDQPVKRVLGKAVRPVVTTQPWMAANEWADAGFEDTQPAPRELDDELEEAAVGAHADADVCAEMATDAYADAEDSTLAEASDATVLSVAVVPPHTQDGRTRDGLDAVVQQFFAQLRVGNRVDMYSGGSWLRAELVWASARGTLFMFTSPGGRAHSMTRRSCEKLIRSKGLRLAETRPVIDAALRQVAQQAPGKRSVAASVPAYTAGVVG